MKLHELAVHVRQLQPHAAELLALVAQFLLQQAAFGHVELIGERLGLPADHIGELIDDLFLKYGSTPFTELI